MLILKLKLEIALSASDRQENLINPINDALGSGGSVLFNLPEYSIDDQGKRVLDNTSIDIKLNKLEVLKVLKEVLVKTGYLKNASLRFKGDYNLLEIV